MKTHRLIIACACLWVDGSETIQFSVVLLSSVKALQRHHAELESDCLFDLRELYMIFIVRYRKAFEAKL